tara:strand:+ start:658 stop:1101 length:444 start_codon:yes stop_codon:yes gene_type:complete
MTDFIQNNLNNLNKIDIIILYCPNDQLQYIKKKKIYIYNNNLDKDTHKKLLLDTINTSLFDFTYNKDHHYNIKYNLSFTINNIIDDVIYNQYSNIDYSLNPVLKLQNINFNKTIFNTIILVIDDFSSNNYYLKLFKTNKTRKNKLLK